MVDSCLTVPTTRQKALSPWARWWPTRPLLQVEGTESSRDETARGSTC